MENNDTEPGEDDSRAYPDTDPWLGAPDGFWENINPDDQIDRRINESDARKRSPAPRRSDDATRSIPKMRTVGVTNNRLNTYGITSEEAAFLQAIVKAMNGELQGYNLTESMTGIKSLYDIDEAKLIRKGYLKRHTGADRRAYYTVTFDGQEACQTSKKQGRRYGDIGSDTPHRVGMELTKRYYESLPNVRYVEVAPRKNGQKTDLIAVNTDHTQRAIIEVEGGRITADPNVSETDRTGLTNYESVQNDYRLLAACAGESIWVGRNYEIAADILQILTSGDDIPFGLATDIIQSVRTKRKRIKDLNQKHITPLQDDGITELLTFKQLRTRLKNQDEHSK